MKLYELIHSLSPTPQLSCENLEISSIEMDSRFVNPGALFICIEGFTVDGHSFVNQAIEKGAVAIVARKPIESSVPVIYVNDTKRAMAVLADSFNGQPTKMLSLIGVTGTNGKTTTTQILDHIFSTNNHKTGLIGTMHIKIGDELKPVSNTTPESIVLQKSFREMFDCGVDVCAMEVSSHALDMGRVHGCDFDVAIFTNLTQDHLDYHHTMDEYKFAKSLLFSQLGNTYDRNHPKFAVLNVDDEASQTFKKVTAAHVITYGIDQECDFRAMNVRLTSKGTAFTLVTPYGSHEISTVLIGKFNVYNLLAAICGAFATGLEITSIIESIQSLEGVRGRFEVVQHDFPFTVIVDYAHTPDSLENVLQTINELEPNHSIVVVGCGGDRDKTKRPIMGRIATEYASYAVFTSDNPRTESPEQILKDIEVGAEEGKFESVLDRHLAIEKALQLAKENDMIVIAGKGHETYQIFKDRTIHFDDVEVVKNILHSMKSANQNI